MTQEAALQHFFSSFDIPAYPLAAVPDDATYPYLTYETVSGLWQDRQFPTVNIYYKTKKMTEINAKVREVATALKDGGVCIPCNDGMLWITTGTPFANVIPAAVDETVKQAVLNINIEFLTI